MIFNTNKPNFFNILTQFYAKISLSTNAPTMKEITPIC